MRLASCQCRYVRQACLIFDVADSFRFVLMHARRRQVRSDRGGSLAAGISFSLHGRVTGVGNLLRYGSKWLLSSCAVQMTQTVFEMYSDV